MLSIDETIARERQQAKEQRSHIGTWDKEYSKKCEVYAEEHDQLAQWLEELKELRNMTAGHLYAVAFKNGYLKAEKEVREKTIDDLIAKCENAKFAESDEIALSDIHTGVNSGLSMSIHFAEQLKAGGENENYNKEES